MTLLKFTGLAVITLTLSACYTTKNNQLIPEGIQIGDGDLTFCLKGECVSAPFIDGRYAVDRPFGADDNSVAFLPLTIANDRQIYIVELREKNDSDAAYHVARVVESPTPQTGDIEAVILECNLDKAAMQKLGLKPGYAPMTCEAPDLATLKQVIIDNYDEDFASETWWSDNKQPL